MSSVRFIISRDYDRSCSYCCNNIKKVSEKFKKINFVKALEKIKDYDVVCLTGGEITLHHLREKVWAFINQAIINNKEIYIYTNGYDKKILKKWVSCVDGINLSYHEGDESFKKKYTINYFDKTAYFGNKFTLKIEENFANKEIKYLTSLLANTHINIKTFKLNKCDVEREDWYEIM